MRLRGLWPSAKGAILIAQHRKGHRGVVRAAAEQLSVATNSLSDWEPRGGIVHYAHIFAIGGRLR